MAVNTLLVQYLVSLITNLQFSSVQSLSHVRLFVPHELQHSRPPCPSPTPRVHPNSCPWSQWCHSAISSSIAPFPSCPQSFPASGSFPVSQLFPSGGLSIGASGSALVLPMNIKGWFLLRLTGLISCCPRDSQESSPAPQFRRINSLALSHLYGPSITSTHDY